MSTKFCHLHCHTSYSLLDGAANIKALLQQSKLLGMPHLAITDHGNMFGVPQFVKIAKNEGVKPIIGCETYLAADMHDHKDKKRYHQLLLAKNEEGYNNLSKLCSLAYTEGFYYKPRIDKKIIKQYAKGLIATTCCLAAEVPQAILHKSEEEAEAIFLSWVEIFGADYYIELQRHGLAEQDQCNKVLIEWSKKHGVKMIATNDVHYIKQADSTAQDIMLCLQTGSQYDDPNRMRFDNDQFYLKSPEEMLKAFSDVPEAVHNTMEIVDKVTEFSLERPILMPVFEVPEGFKSQEEYLTHLSFAGAEKRYGTISPELKARLDYELGVILKMGFAGYFLIVQDMVDKAKSLGVFVGPGRGSGVGSVVAYCLGITDVEPLHYKLLFERFLNPERVSMPDFDIDFDDEGRQKVIDYLVEKYGHDQVSHIITFNAMGAKSAIRDVGRVLGLPLSKTDALAKLVPDKLGTTLSEACAEVPELKKYLDNADKTLEGKVLATSLTLEGSPRHTGIHASAVLIAPKKLIELIPVKTDKNSHLLVSQYDGSVVESVGMLKMDLLGLKTLSIIRDALRLIEEVHEKEIDIYHLPLDDALTFQLYQAGNTVGIFQFESEGMRAYLQQLKPTVLSHLITMNALYRPGPMQNIPTYIARMHGKAKIDTMHPALKEVLGSTYGIPVFQEQIMQMAQVIAGYSLGQADILRRAMGKKKREEMQKQATIFIAGAKEHHKIEEKRAKEIFDTMSHFAEYGFNLSHAAAYTLLSYRAAYLKAHFPTAYMASVLIHNQRNIDKISFFIEECTQMGIKVKGPDVNESHLEFSNDRNKTIRFGLAPIKSIGKKAVESLVEERKKNGPFKDLNGLVYRLIVANPTAPPRKKVLETLALVGAFDSWRTYHRKQYIHAEEGQNSFIHQVIDYQKRRYAQEMQNKQTLFALMPPLPMSPPPTPPTCLPYSDIEKLKIEKELVGFYISGHPLAPYTLELRYFCNANTSNLLTLQNRKALQLAGMIVKVAHRQNSKGSFFGILTLEDHKGTFDFILFGETYNKYRHMFVKDLFVYITGKLQLRYGREGQWDFRIASIEPLEMVAEKYTKGLQFHLALENLSTAFVDKIAKLCKTYKGKCNLEVRLPYPDTPARPFVVVSAKGFPITPSKQFFNTLQEEGVSFSLKTS